MKCQIYERFRNCWFKYSMSLKQAFHITAIYLTCDLAVKMLNVCVSEREWVLWNMFVYVFQSHFRFKLILEISITFSKCTYIKLLKAIITSYWIENHLSIFNVSSRWVWSVGWVLWMASGRIDFCSLIYWKLQLTEH